MKTAGIFQGFVYELGSRRGGRFAQCELLTDSHWAKSTGSGATSKAASPLIGVERLDLRRTAFALVVLHLFLVAEVKAVAIDWRTIGNPGNAPDTAVMLTDHTTGYGAVPYAYRIGTYDVTNSQYAEFLNTKDPLGSNAFGLYVGDMGTDPLNGGIAFNLASTNGSKYSVVAGHGNQPATYVTWYSAIRFANWLNNGQGNSSTETGAYTLGALGPGAQPIDGNSITRNPGATVFLPSEDEWYKAAFYDPATNSYFQFATSTNSQPSHGAPPGSGNSANYTPGGWPNPDYANALGHMTDVGAYLGAVSPYGTYDQSGNVDQWNESLQQTKIGLARGLRGGAYNYVWDHMLSTYRSYATAQFGWYGNVGFRLGSSIVAPVPEPSSWALAAMGFAGLAACGWRRHLRHSRR